MFLLCIVLEIYFYHVSYSEMSSIALENVFYADYFVRVFFLGTSGIVLKHTGEALPKGRGTEVVCDDINR